MGTGWSMVHHTIWAAMQIDPARRPAIEKIARRIVSGRAQYDVISRASHVPWFVVGIIHALDGELRWNAEWEATAAANRFKARLPRSRWNSIEDIASALEEWDGLGYRQRGVHSPYLWGWTTAHIAGRIVGDGVFLPGAEAEAPGAMAVLRAMVEIDPLGVDISPPAMPPWPCSGAATAAGWFSTAASSITVWCALSICGLVAADGYLHAWLALASGDSSLGALAVLAHKNFDAVQFCVVSALVATIVVRHVRDKRSSRD